MRFAVIQDGTVVNILVADEPLNEQWVQVDDLDPAPNKGWGYKDGEFIMPSVDETPETKQDVITIETVEWFREHLTEELERAIRLRVLVDDEQDDTKSLKVFIDMIDARPNLQVSDAGYKDGILLIHSMGLCSDTKRDELLAVGGHSDA